MEEWKSVTGYEGYYEVSNYGNVRALERTVTRSDGVCQIRKQHIKSQSPNTDGYPTVNLCKDGKSIRMSVHILVAKEFVDGYFDGAEVNHKDCDRTNNNYKNLEWVTHRDNVLYAIDMGNHVCRQDICGSKNPNYGNHKLSEVYKNDKALSIEKQSRPGTKNGRSKAVEVVINGVPMKFGYMAECAKYLIDNGFTNAKSENSVSTSISNAARFGKKYNGLSFKFV